MSSPGVTQLKDGEVRVHIPPSPPGVYGSSESFPDIENGKKEKVKTGVSMLTRLKKQLTAELYVTGRIDNLFSI